MANDTSGIRISAELRRGLEEETRALLISRARVRGMVSYSDLTERITTVQIGPRDRLLYDILDKISEDEHRAGRGMLSCIVVHKAGDMEPGVGFYELAERLGKNRRDKLSVWVNELHAVHAAWEQPKNCTNLASQPPTQKADGATPSQRSSLCPPLIPARTTRRAAKTRRPGRVSG